jgi:hypoxanthine phosphoribosyltransferase
MDSIKDTVLSKGEIAARVAELGEDITEQMGPNSINMLVVLKGAMVFASDLLQCINLPVHVSVISASSYCGRTTSPVRKPAIHLPPAFTEQLGRRPTLVVDDILDQGATLVAVWGMLYKHGIRNVKTCVLLRKRLTTEQPKVDYVGFDIPNEFVVGYGLDYNELYRNLPELCILKPEVYK